MPDYQAALDATSTGSRLRVRVVPRAGSNRLDGLHGTAIKVRLTAPPADGRANAALLGLLGELLGVPVRDLELRRGSRSRDKTVDIHGLDPGAAAARPARTARG